MCIFASLKLCICIVTSLSIQMPLLISTSDVTSPQQLFIFHAVPFYINFYSSVNNVMTFCATLIFNDVNMNKTFQMCNKFLLLYLCHKSLYQSLKTYWTVRSHFAPCTTRTYQLGPFIIQLPYFSGQTIQLKYYKLYKITLMPW